MIEILERYFAPLLRRAAPAPDGPNPKVMARMIEHELNVRAKKPEAATVTLKNVSLK